MLEYRIRHRVTANRGLGSEHPPFMRIIDRDVVLLEHGRGRTKRASQPQKRSTKKRVTWLPTDRSGPVLVCDSWFLPWQSLRHVDWTGWRQPSVATGEQEDALISAIQRH